MAAASSTGAGGAGGTVGTVAEKFRWKNVSTVSELGENMIRYLRGEISESPWQISPIDPETVGILEPLIRVNELGYITSSGQPGTFIFPVRNYKTGDIITPSSRDTTIRLAEIQHGYMTGIINKKKISVADIIARVAKVPTVCALIYEYSTGYYSQINAPTSGDVRESEYSLTINAQTRNGRDILKRNSDLTHNLADIRLYADGFTDAIEDEDLLQEIGGDCVFVVFIHNVVGSLEKPDAGLGLEGKVAGFLSGRVLIADGVEATKLPSDEGRARGRRHRRSVSVSSKVKSLTRKIYKQSRSV